MKLWKDTAGSWRFIGSYTNSFMDDDWPARDIITSGAHEKAVASFNSGEVPLPPLLLWHTPDWKVGQVDAVFIDKQGDGQFFVIATGTIDRDKEAVVPHLTKFSQMSHGLFATEYAVSLSGKEPTRNITEYTTYEISALPDNISRPANGLTWFEIERKGNIEEAQKMIDPMARAQLEAVIPSNVLDDIEAANHLLALAAEGMGVSYKERTPDKADVTNGDNMTTNTRRVSVTKHVAATDEEEKKLPEATQTAEVLKKDETVESNVAVNVENEEVTGNEEAEAPAAEQPAYDSIAAAIVESVTAKALSQFTEAAAVIIKEQASVIAEMQTTVKAMAEEVAELKKAKDTPVAGNQFLDGILKALAKDEESPAQPAKNEEILKGLTGPQEAKSEPADLYEKLFGGK